MIKEEPNPQFLKDFDLPRLKQVDTLSQNILQNSENQRSKNEIFDFGISDQDWSRSKKGNQSNNVFEQLPQEKEFEILSLEPSDKQTIQQKKLKLQQAYLSSRQARYKQKEESELQEIIKFNSQAESASKLRISSRVQMKKAQEDFFSLADMQDENQAQFSVFDLPNSFRASHSKDIKPSQELYHRQQEQASSETIEHYQTESLLQSQQGAQSKVFSLKYLDLSICLIKFGIHLVSITVVSMIFGFMPSLIFLILHDFSQFLFVIVEFLLKTKAQKIIPPTENSQKQIFLSMSDEISQTHTFGSKERHIASYIQHQKNLRLLIKFHSLFKISFYVSLISFIGFIIVHITQIDYFFSTNYFSLINWSPIIVLIVILIVQGIWNCKMAKKIDEILFYEKNVLQDVRIFNSKNRQNYGRTTEHVNW